MSEERLTSWKEIAAYLGVTVRTAQRWESVEDLPVRRHRHSRLSTVYADRRELDRWWRNRPAAAERPKAAPTRGTSVAVLPFVNLDRDEESEILGDGLTEDLITALSQIPGLRVIARSSVFYFRGSSLDVREVGARLGVGNLLEGSIRRSGRRLRVTAQLVSAEDGRHVWARRFDREMEDPFDLQEQLAQAIAEGLRVRLLDDTGSPARPRDPDTYRAFLRGRFFWRQRKPASLERALACYEDAIARDPGFAAAHAGVADCYTFLWIYGGRRRSDVIPKAEAAVARALELDSEAGDAYAALGTLRVTERDFPGAERAFGNALRLNPNDHRARHWRGSVLSCLGRHEEALADFENALEADPFGANVNSDTAFALYLAGRYDEAILRYRHTLEIGPEAPLLRVKLGLALFHAGKPEEARGETSQEPVVAAWMQARTGHPKPAEALLEGDGDAPLSFTRQAVLRLGLGQTESALDLYRRGARRYEREFLPLYTCMRPEFERLGLTREFELLLGQGRT